MSGLHGPRQLPPTPNNNKRRLSKLIRNPSTYGAPEPVPGAEVYGYDEPASLASPSIGSPKSQHDFDLSRSTNRNSVMSIEADYHVKIVCVGDGGCGKTCMLSTYAHGIFPERYVPTVFENYVSKIDIPHGKVVELALWDTAGQEEYDRLRALSYPEVDVLFICYSVDSPASLENVYDKWLPEVSHYCPDIPIILVALKTDLRDDHAAQRLLESKGLSLLQYEDGLNVAKRINAYKYMEVSAMTEIGLRDVFNTAISVVVKQPSRSSLVGPSLSSLKKPSSRPSSPNKVARKPVGGASIDQGLSRPLPAPVFSSSVSPALKNKRKRCVIL